MEHPGNDGVRYRVNISHISRKSPDMEMSGAAAAIDQWRSPVLLMHGDDDWRVAFEQSVKLFQALREICKGHHIGKPIR